MKCPIWKATVLFCSRRKTRPRSRYWGCALGQVPSLLVLLNSTYLYKVFPRYLPPVCLPSPSNDPQHLSTGHLPYFLLKPSWLVYKQPKSSWCIVQPNYPTFTIDWFLLLTHIFGEKFYTTNFYTQFKSNLRPTTIHSVANKDLSTLLRSK